MLPLSPKPKKKVSVFRGGANAAAAYSAFVVPASRRIQSGDYGRDLRDARTKVPTLVVQPEPTVRHVKDVGADRDEMRWLANVRRVARECPRADDAGMRRIQIEGDDAIWRSAVLHANQPIPEKYQAIHAIRRDVPGSRNPLDGTGPSIHGDDAQGIVGDEHTPSVAVGREPLR
jgi:hypothetical protein